MFTVRKVGSIIEKLKEMLEEYLEKTKPKYYPPVKNLLDLVYEHYTENNSGRESRKGKRKGTGNMASRLAEDG